MIALSWTQVIAWRLTQHDLMQRVKREDMLAAVTSIIGVQAQVMSAAELALSERVEGISPEDVQFAFWEERSLVRTWAMRGTLPRAARMKSTARRAISPITASRPIKMTPSSRACDRCFLVSR